MTKCLNSTTNDIELDLLLAKTTTFSSSLTLLNQLVNNYFLEFNELNLFEQINEVKHFLEQEKDNDRFEQEQERLLNMRNLLKRVLENTQVFDTR